MEGDMENNSLKNQELGEHFRYYLLTWSLSVPNCQIGT